MKVNMAMRKLGMLMWKHYKLRKHRWFMTALEIILPILLIGICISGGKTFISSEGITRKNATVYHKLSVSEILNTAKKFDRFVYTPNTTRSNQIIQAAVNIIAAGQRISIETEAVDNETQLEIILTANNTVNGASRAVTSIGIVFSEPENAERFAYKLRDTDNWSTEDLFPKQIESSPHKENPYLHQGFVGVQLALDKAFLDSQEVPVPKQEFKFQLFPYPEYDEENPFRSSVPVVVYFVVIVTLLILSIPLISAVIEERESGVKELMKIVGVQEWLIWLSWFLNALVLSFLSFTVVTYILQHEFFGPSSAAIRCVYPTVLWSCIMLFCIANTAFCFTFTAIFHKPTIAGTVYFLVVFLGLYAMFWIDKLKSVFLHRLACLLPVGAFIEAFSRMQYFEIHDIPLSWLKLTFVEPNTTGVSLGFAFFMLIFDTILYLFLAYYINAVNPGKFGVKKSPLFIFQNCRFRNVVDILTEKRLKSKFQDNASQELVNLEDPPSDHIERAPSDRSASIRIKDLHKNFGSVYAVKGVNLTVYSNEITALLGHNGAGKTTTMAMLTGLIKPTAGTIIYKNDMDVLKRMDAFRQNLGMCTQEDRLFPYLTVMDHLLFFGMLKGATRQEAMQEAMEYMRLMEIDSKAHSLCSDLSGGMKRKLCLSISLMGKADTLILDEPTSGLDVESRRRIWDLLLAMRVNRTIILTTHHMEEADVLGDRIAIMHHGVIVCHGTSIFLKKSYGTGYHLTVTKQQDVPEEMITNTIQKEGDIQDVEVHNNSSTTEIVYTLPLSETKKFSRMFLALETKKKELGIENMGISCTTMEQVFLKVGGASVFDSSQRSRKNSSVTDGAVLANYAERKKVGLSLITQQMKALMRKKWLYTSRNYMNFVYRILLPTVVCLLILRGPLEFDYADTPLTLSLNTYPNTKLLLRHNFDSAYYNQYMNFVKSNNVEIVGSSNASIIEALLDLGRQDVAKYQKDIILAAEFNQSEITLLNNPFAIHSLPIAINTYSNALLQTTHKSSVISVINHPLKGIQEVCQTAVGRYTLLTLWFIGLAFYSADLNTYFQLALNVERIDGFKHIQLMSSVSPLVYWLSNFVFDYVFYFVVILGRVILLKISDDRYSFLAIDHHLAVFFLIVGLFIAGSVLFAYVISYLNGSKEGSYILLFIFNFLGTIVVSLMYVWQTLTFNLGDTVTDFSIWTIVYYLVYYLVLLLPPLNYFLMFIKFFNTWYANTQCNRCRILPCANLPYLVFASAEYPDGILKEMLFAIFGIFLYAGLLAAIQMGFVNQFLNFIVGKMYEDSATTSPDTHSGDNDVKLEKDRVNRAAPELSGHTTETVLVAQGLKKNYIRMFRPFTAVNDVNFTVSAGECFGLLGINGAGKSTTFKILTADLLPTKGDASILGIKLSARRTEYLSKAGYCAQSNCFLEELSGREMLTLIASLRGVRSDQVKNMVDKWLSILGLEEYQNQRCGGYSGGNKRKLCTAMSLIGDPHVVFLDEPTSGVDPVSRRRLYAVMDQSKASGQAVVLTSHSMEECENLCDRLTILARGQMQCIGTAQHLKKTYAQGFSVLVKIRDAASEGDVKRLKKRIGDKFDNQYVLKDEHKTQLYYQLTNVNSPWSFLFKTMEDLKDENNLIEDYTLSDTSLEEVFISFAKQSSAAK